MKNKKLWIQFNLLLMVLLYIPMNIIAQSVSQQEAEMVALRFANQTSKQANKHICKTETISQNGKANMYLVSMNEGWVLISSERAATPILAESPDGVFPSYDDMPDGMRWILSYYENALQYARDSLQENTEDKDWEYWLNADSEQSYLRAPRSVNAQVLSRLADVKWNQSYNNDISCTKPYNYYCPTWVHPSCSHAYVGCTAVAMGQIMWYFQWPHSAIVPACMNDSNGNVCGAVRLAEYNWGLIPTAIYSSTPWEQVKETAAFLRDCGYACHMKYRLHGSFASLGDAMDAMEDMFHYQSMHHRWRNLYIGNWTNKLKSELDAGRPIIYTGYNDTTGHTFVIFGYTDDNRFRINWGWRGQYINASYTLDALQPNLSTPNSIAYNDDQEALWGIYPEFPYCTSITFDADDVSDNPFEIYGGSVVSSVGTTISSGKTGLVYAGQMIQVLPPFSIQNGANVHLAIRDMHCIASTLNYQSGLVIEERDTIDNGEPERFDLPAPIEIYPSEEDYLPSNGDGKTYNLFGQPVDETYHGIVIQNGQKRVQ